MAITYEALDKSERQMIIRESLHALEREHFQQEVNGMDHQPDLEDKITNLQKKLKDSE